MRAASKGHTLACEEAPSKDVAIQVREARGST
jgi:hypothetical protein